MVSEIIVVLLHLRLFIDYGSHFEKKTQRNYFPQKLPTTNLYSVLLFLSLPYIIVHAITLQIDNS